jgi:hypothetical protein
MAMYEIGWLDQIMLVALWVGLIYGLFGLALGYLALTDLEWRQLIAERMKVEWRGMKGSKFKVQSSKLKSQNLEP